MGLLDGMLDMLPENVNLDSVADKIGLSTDELKTGGEALFTKLQDGNTDAVSAITETAAETGIDATKLKALLPEMASQFGADGEDGFLSKLTGNDGILGKVGGFLDRDGDGNPLNDITDMAKGFFKK